MEQLNRLENQMDAEYHAAAKQFGLSDSELDVLYCFAMDDHPYTLSELCAKSYATKQTMSSSLQNMKKKGWIFYEAGADKRKKLVHLTPEGIQIRKRTADRLVELEFASMKEWDEADIQLISQLIQKYGKNVEARYGRLLDEKK